MKYRSFLIFMVFCFVLTGCDKFRSWFDKKATQTVVGATDQASLLRLKSDLRTIRRSVEIFHGQEGRYPDSLDELAEKGAIHRIPKEAFGGEWIYDRFKGSVESSSRPGLSLE
ncbi:hypothetical protein K8T06_08635 [bacterium]|nr:hypothetical protein [bacterium]